MGAALGLAGLGLAGSTSRVVGYFTEPRLRVDAIHRVEGEPARHQAHPSPGRLLTVVTWNIERGTRFAEVLDTLRRLDADLYLLQEVDAHAGRSGWRDVAPDLAGALAMNWVRAGEFQEIGEGRPNRAALTGQAVLSRYPITGASVISFSSQGRLRWRVNPTQPRRGGRIALKVRTAGLVAYDVHLESGRYASVRRRQLQEILADAAGEDGRAPVVIAGDFNNRSVRETFLFELLAAAGFDGAGGEAAWRRAAPTARRRHPVDWIFPRHVRVRAMSVGDGRLASDHDPVLATLELP